MVRVLKEIPMSFVHNAFFTCIIDDEIHPNSGEMYVFATPENPEHYILSRRTFLNGSEYFKRCVCYLAFEPHKNKNHET